MRLRECTLEKYSQLSYIYFIVNYVDARSFKFTSLVDAEPDFEFTTHLLNEFPCYRVEFFF